MTSFFNDHVLSYLLVCFDVVFISGIIAEAEMLTEMAVDAIDTEEDIATEKSRCARYGYDYNPIIKKRRSTIQILRTMLQNQSYK